jgi:hypothetical protein
MDQSTALKLGNAKSLLIIVPTDRDYSAILTGVAIALALAPNHIITILNDTITTDPVLIYKLKGYKFNALHSRATKSYTLTLDKEAYKIKETFVDETDEKLSLTFQVNDQSIPTDKLFNLRMPRLDQEIVLQINTEGYILPNKYQSILSRFAPEKVEHLNNSKGDKYDQISALNALNLIETAKGTLTPEIAQLFLNAFYFQNGAQIESLDQFHSTFIEKLLGFGASLHTARRELEQIQTGADMLLTSLALQRLVNAGNGIYYALVEDKENNIHASPYFEPIFAHLIDCKVAFLVLSHKKKNHVYITRQSDDFSIKPLIEQYKGEGSESYGYFVSKIETKTLVETIMRILINPNATQVVSTQAQITETQKEKEDTDSVQDPLTPAQTTIVELPVENAASSIQEPSLDSIPPTKEEC